MELRLPSSMASGDDVDGRACGDETDTKLCPNHGNKPQYKLLSALITIYAFLAVITLLR